MVDRQPGSTGKPVNVHFQVSPPCFQVSSPSLLYHITTLLLHIYSIYFQKICSPFSPCRSHRLVPESRRCRSYLGRIWCVPQRIFSGPRVGVRDQQIGASQMASCERHRHGVIVNYSSACILPGAAVHFVTAHTSQQPEAFLLSHQFTLIVKVTVKPTDG